MGGEGEGERFGGSTSVAEGATGRGRGLASGGGWGGGGWGGGAREEGSVVKTEL